MKGKFSDDEELQKNWVYLESKENYQKTEKADGDYTIMVDIIFCPTFSRRPVHQGTISATHFSAEEFRVQFAVKSRFS